DRHQPDGGHPHRGPRDGRLSDGREVAAASRSLSSGKHRGRPAHYRAGGRSRRRAHDDSQGGARPPEVKGASRPVFLSNPKAQTKYDVIIVGSGAGGGMAAYQLAVSGLKVLVLEAGRRYDPV